MAKSILSDKLAIITSQQTKEREYWYAKMAGEPAKSFFYYDFKETGEGGEQEYIPPGNEVESRLVEIFNHPTASYYDIN